MELTVDERAELTAVISVGFDRAVASRANMILDYAAGIGVSEIAASSGATRPTVYKLLARYKEDGIAGLDNHKSPGRPRVVTEVERARIIALTKNPPPEPVGLPHWSSHEMAKYLKRHEGIDVSHNFVSGLWRENDLKPRRNGTFKTSKDPGFSAKVTEIIGLHLNPPAGVVALSFDGKTQVQARECTRPILPISLGETERRAHGYSRHGVTNLFSALEVLSGQAAAACMLGKRTGEVLKFMNKVYQSHPEVPEIHVILGNISSRSGEDVKAWLAEHPNFAVHYTPTGASWICQVEDWFVIITRQAVRRGSFKSLASLINRIDDFVKHWNQDTGPFEWTAAADGTLAKAAILNRDYKKLVAGRPMR